MALSRNWLLAALALPLLGTLGVRAALPETPAELARDAVSKNPRMAEGAIASLRALGPAGLDVLLAANAATLAAHQPAGRLDPAWQRLTHALDGVARQRDAWAAELYWYTDLAAAEREATRLHRPILSLRLLGKLDEEYSCANSRFFRTALYPNHAIAQRLHDHFVLHWASERPAPRVTIDFGGGRRLVRTLTGNSVHYVLDAAGHPLDALPGLYGPAAWLRELGQAEALATRLAALPAAQRQAALVRYHRERAASIPAETARAIAALPPTLAPLPRTLSFEGLAPTALDAAPLAFSKGITQMPMLNALSPLVGAPADDATLARLAAARLEDARLDERSVQVLAEHLPPGTQDIAATRAHFERAIALDTVTNEARLRPTLHTLMADAGAASLEELDARVYAELFKTPRTDPWVGLYPVDTYTGLTDGGVVGAAAATP